MELTFTPPEVNNNFVNVVDSSPIHTVRSVTCDAQLSDRGSLDTSFRGGRVESEVEGWVIWGGDS